jgi:putative membrane-bound dehydrogenase-like protein
MRYRLLVVVPFLVVFVLAGERPGNAQGKKEVIPHGQSQPPGPALSPAEAIKKMQVPAGFHVELVIAEPDLVNPVAMTFDEQGRIWITESIEYPRRSAGPGKDRVKVFKSTKGDGKFDKITTVIDGLNIPSGVAVGHGGVWIANSPDILFYPFEDFAAPKLGKPQVVVTGFGRDDTHELPNSLTWGPDGWLYGLNGVFNRSHVKHKGKTFDFTCALFRIHPKTKDFEIFCEGTSNPWGLAFNDNGDAFVSACVIDHLWHLTETGYYHRQGGPYPPFTWKIGSIVKHKHQKAAYCGLCWFDSDAYPPEYREKLYMGNIHGNCINSDELTRDGSTYAAKPRPDFLTANDAWFMPVAQKVGPDGCMYILDWYDRYHCYQDANRDPKGIDRLKGRLYRVVYKDYKPAGNFSLAQESNDKLIERLHTPNSFFRESAQRLLTERLARQPGDTIRVGGSLGLQLEGLVNDDKAPRTTRMHALWALLGNGGSGAGLLAHADPGYRACGVRAFGNAGTMTPATRTRLMALAADPSRDVKLQVAIAARKVKGLDAMLLLMRVLAECGDDKLIPHIVWQNLHPLLEKDGDRFLALAGKVDLAKAPGVAKVLPRAIDRILGNASGDPAAVVRFIEKLLDDKNNATAGLCLAALTTKVQNGEIAGPALVTLKKSVARELSTFFGHRETGPAAIYLIASLGDPNAAKIARGTFESGPIESERLLCLDALMTGSPATLKQCVPAMLGLANPKMPDFRSRVLMKLGKLSEPWIADAVLANYAKFNADEQAKAIELLTQRPIWAKELFKEIAARKVGKGAININQARRLLAARDAELAKLVEKHWGVPRDGRNPERENIVAQMRDLIKKTPGNAKAGVAVFKKICAQCHRIYGEGVDVGPDITANGRSDFEQLLSNVFDPSLVIGTGYQTTTVITDVGQIITGLVVEESKQRVVLKMQGGELKTIARANIDEIKSSRVSLMPEGVERQLQPQEIADLFAFLCLDRPPGDPKARKIPGTPR